ncbi:MAG: hypothetical protein C7B46_03415, partial [Sulfobacillus benefaciens]
MGGAKQKTRNRLRLSQKRLAGEAGLEPAHAGSKVPQSGSFYVIKRLLICGKMALLYDSPNYPVMNGYDSSWCFWMFLRPVCGPF